jgi:hypothetical protein
VKSIGLDLGLPVIAIEPLDHLAAGERAAGVVEERLALPRRLLEGGKLAADEIEIQRITSWSGNGGS